MSEQNHETIYFMVFNFLEDRIQYKCLHTVTVVNITSLLIL